MGKSAITDLGIFKSHGRCSTRFHALGHEMPELAWASLLPLTFRKQQRRQKEKMEKHVILLTSPAILLVSKCKKNIRIHPSAGQLSKQPCHKSDIMVSFLTKHVNLKLAFLYQTTNHFRDRNNFLHKFLISQTLKLLRFQI